MPVRVLAIGAHPDDVELLCAGTLAHYARQGADPFIAVMTRGELGSGGRSKMSVSSIRELEARHSASVIGADLLWLDQADGFLFDTVDTRLMTVDLYRTVKPDIVFAHHPHDYHPDHRAAGELATIARLFASLQTLETIHGPMTKVPSLFYMDTFRGLSAPHPDVWIDVSATMACKEEMLAKHESQTAATDGVDLKRMMREQAKMRGVQIGVEHAEAFFCAAAFPVTSIADLTPARSNLSLPMYQASPGLSAASLR